MYKSKRLLALICALSMVFSVLTGFTVVRADNSNGYVLELDEAASTDLEKFINVKYTGFAGGVRDGNVALSFDAANVASVEQVEGSFAVTGATTAENKDLVSNGEYYLPFAGAKAAITENNMIVRLKVVLKEAKDLTLALNQDATLSGADAVDGKVTEYWMGGAEGTDLLPSASITVKAPEPVPTAIPDAPAVTKGMVLELNEAESSDLEKVINVKYVGFAGGVRDGNVALGFDATNVASVAMVDGSFAVTGATTSENQNLVPNGEYYLPYAGAKAAIIENGIIVKVKVTLKAALENDLVVSLLPDATISGATEVDGKTTELWMGGEEGVDLLPSTYVVLRAAAATDAPATDAPASDAPASDAPSTQDPSVTAEPTKVPSDPRPTPVATTAPTDGPDETTAPTDGPTAYPTAEPVTKGMVLELNEAESSELEKVINVKYVGFPGGVRDGNIALGFDATNVASVAMVDGSFAVTGATTSENQNLVPNGEYYLPYAGAKCAIIEDGIIAKIKVTLKEALKDNLIVSLLPDATISGATEVDGKTTELWMGGEEGVDLLPSTYVVLAPTPAATAEPTESPEPTTEPTAVPELGKVALDKIVSAEKAEEAEKADKTTYVTLTITTKDGKPAVYGVDYVAKDGDKVLTKEEFYNTIWGYNSGMKPSEAIKKFDIVAYTPDLNVSAKLNVVGEDEALDNGSEVVAPSATAEPTTKPTAAPDPNGVEFAGWATKAVTVSKNTSKSVGATFKNIPEDAEDVEISFYVDDDTLVKIVSTSSTSVVRGQAKATVKVQAKKSIKDSTSVSAELTYTLDGKEYSVSSTKDLTVKTTSSSNNGGNGGSGVSGGTAGILAGPNTSGPSLRPWQENGEVYFQDLDQAPWAEDAITYLAKCGIINGRSATAFEPMGEITRAEFAKLVVTIYGINVGEGIQANVYPDVVGGDWYTPYVNAAAQYGIVTGYPDGMFRPNALVSRQEMAVMMYRAITTFNTQLPTINPPKTWSDAIPAWSADAINALQVAGVMNGVSATEFGATDASTRAMAAQMIYNLYSVVAN